MKTIYNKPQFLILVIFLCLTNNLLAQDNFVWFPDKTIYPHYIADPLQPTSSFRYIYFDKTTIDDTSDNRLDIKLGGTFLLAEWKSQDNSFPIFQLALDGGFHGQFDLKNKVDNIGWNGIYGLRLFYRLNNELAFNIGSKHISSHVGDELQERTGRTRINYTREEVLVGLVWSFNRNTDIYIDFAHAYDIGNEALQAPWRMQTGLQYQSPNILWNQQFGWYAAVDISTFEESDWDKNITLQTGIYTDRDTRTWRIGVELYDGRAQISEFFQDRERYIGVGIWYNLK